MQIALLAYSPHSLILARTQSRGTSEERHYFWKEETMSVQWLFEIIEDRRKNPIEKSYTSSLFAEGLSKIAQKVGEEGTEVVIATLAQDDQRLIEEVADLTYHTLVLLSARGLTPTQILAELKKRHV